MNPHSGTKPLGKPTGKKRALLVIGGIAAAFAVVVLSLALLVDMKGYQSRLESAASKALGLDVRILGDMDLELFPPVGLSITDLEIARAGEDVLRVERMRAYLKIFPLLLGRVRFRGLEFVRPVLSIRRTTGGPFDFERYVYRPLQAAGEILPGGLDHIDEISVSGGNGSYAGRDSAFRAEAEGLDLTIRDIAFQGNPGEDPFRNASFSGTGKIARAAAAGAEVLDISFEMTGKNGNYEMNPITLQAFGGTGEGSIWVSLTEPTPLVQVRYSLLGSRVGQIFSASGRKRGLLEGTMALSANLFMKGEYPDEWIGTMTGDVSRKGNDLAVLDFDPDALLSSKCAEKGTALERLGALLLPGPPVTDAARGLSGPETDGETTGEQGMIKTLVSDWAVKNGVFEANDVAFSSKQHRIALKGKIDLPADRFTGITVALVDDRGCARAGRTIEGLFRSPHISDAGPARRKAPPAETAARKTEMAGSGAECEPFYTGSVPPPQ